MISPETYVASSGASGSMGYSRSIKGTIKRTFARRRSRPGKTRKGHTVSGGTSLNTVSRSAGGGLNLRPGLATSVVGNEARKGFHNASLCGKAVLNIGFRYGASEGLGHCICGFTTPCFHDFFGKAILFSLCVQGESTPVL